MLKFSIMVAILLVSVGVYGSNINLSYAQNQALSQSGNSEAEQEIEQAQSSSQDTQCVSGEVTALSCNNLGLQVQRNGDNDEGGEERPVPPSDLGCNEDTVWDVTVREEEDGGIPVGSVVCLEQGLETEHGADVITPGGDVVRALVFVTQLNGADCDFPDQEQRAQVTSGVPPSPLEMGDFVCIDTGTPF